MGTLHGSAVLMLAVVAAGIGVAQRNDSTAVLTGSAAFGEWRKDKPGVRRLLTPQDQRQPCSSAVQEW